MAIVIAVVMPVQGTRRYRVLANPDTPPARRWELLRRSMAVKWSLVPPCLVLGVLQPGVVWWLPSPFGWWLTVELLVGVAVGALVLRHRLRSPRQRARLGRAVMKFAGILPRTQRERRTWIGVAVTAGVTEELVYRGFLLAYVAAVVPQLGAVGAAVVAGAVFGLAHAYQGWRGMALTGLLGAVFGVVCPEVGLIALMVVHVLIDLRILLVPSDLYIETDRQTTPSAPSVGASPVNPPTAG